MKAIDARRFIRTHLTVRMLMVALDSAVSSTWTVAQTHDYLEDRDYDLALLATDDVRIVHRADVRAHYTDQPAESVMSISRGPRRDRLIEDALPLWEAALRLAADPEPLLVVGDGGPTHIVTVADFDSPAGGAATMTTILAVDATLDSLLRRHAEAVEELFPDIDQPGYSLACRFERRAHEQNVELSVLSYASMGSRFALLLSPQVQAIDGRLFDSSALGTPDERELLLRVRNGIAHADEQLAPGDALAALIVADRVLERFAL